MRAVFIVALGMPLLTGCDEERPAPSDSPAKKAATPEASSPPAVKPGSAARSAEARELLDPLKKGLKGALAGALATGAPEDALEACQVSAPELTASQNKAGVRMGRSSPKLRNPKNRPPAWVVPLMNELSQEKSPLGKSRTADLPDGRYGYVETIGTASLCLACHGTEISAGVTAKLKELYPEDRATGFQAGDFRGVFWVELPASE